MPTILVMSLISVMLYYLCGQQIVIDMLYRYVALRLDVMYEA